MAALLSFTSMTSEEQFEVLKEEYIIKAEAHLSMLKGLRLQNFEQTGIKGRLYHLRNLAVCSYHPLLKLIRDTKIKF